MPNGDEIYVSTEPVPNTALSIKGGKSRVGAHVRGAHKCDVCVHDMRALHICSPV